LGTLHIRGIPTRVAYYGTCHLDSDQGGQSFTLEGYYW
jgi:hypothetical protein